MSLKFRNFRQDSALTHMMTDSRLKNKEFSGCSDPIKSLRSLEALLRVAKVYLFAMSFSNDKTVVNADLTWLILSAQATIVGLQCT